MSDFEFKVSESSVRVALLALLATLIYSVIVLQLWNVQIRKGEEHREKVSKQYARKIRIPAVRGRIFSADGVLLAGNRPSYDIVLHLSEMRQPGRRAKTLEHILAESRRIGAAIGRRSPLKPDDVGSHMNIYPGIPMTLFKDLDEKELAKAAELAPSPPGMEIVADPLRDYPCGQLAAHVLGYVGPDDPKSAEDRADFFYYLPDIVGKSGVERCYDSRLRGSPGKKLVIVNHKGFVHELVGSPTPALNGHDIELTIDAKAQSLAEKALEGRLGAFIVMDAKSGALLAMASSPSFKPGDFVPKITSSEWRALTGNPARPLFNRAALGSYTPGSIFKPVVAISLLEHGLSTSLEVDCDGGTPIGSTRIRCWSWRSGGHGPVNIEKAIEVSCNDFFIENGMKLGLDSLSETMLSAGLGSPTGFPLPESEGVMPTRDEKLRLYKERWNEFDTALLSIGQGFIQETPLQAACYTAAIANGGTLWKPHILRKAIDADGNVIYTELPAVKGRLAAKAETLDIVRKGMALAVSSPQGSAKAARNSKIELCGKTGTAEMGPKDARYTNVWFIGFGQAPDGRLLSIVVFIEKGDSGGRTCAPLASKFFEAWLP